MTAPSRSAVRHAFLGAVLVAVTGCGKPVQRGQAEGVVRCNGQPLADVRVTFVPSENLGRSVVRAEGTTDDQGRFDLQSDDNESGVIVGHYSVIVEDMAVYSAPRARDGTVLKRPPARFSPKFRDLRQTPLHEEIHVGTQKIEIDLSR
ncbi:MAG TPA: hypothetical protein VK395_28215 [Gemmataceae bacterium]|nr:hypothetical protein [Gemmataceae bacterium]